MRNWTRCVIKERDLRIKTGNIRKSETEVEGITKLITHTHTHRGKLCSFLLLLLLKWLCSPYADLCLLNGLLPVISNRFPNCALPSYTLFMAVFATSEAVQTIHI
jgi:hypothetical protein